MERVRGVLCLVNGCITEMKAGGAARFTCKTEIERYRAALGGRPTGRQNET